MSPCKRLVTALLLLASGCTAQANPSGATVVNGTVSFSQPNPSTLNITNTPGAIVNWQQFGIAQGELTRFIQQSASSAILNRVTGQDPSQILGQLQSNGRVFLINPNGVIFGQNAVIDTAGMIASTLNLSDDNFLNGHLHFEDLANNATILNQGFIHTSNAGEVVLVAPTVQNEGVIDVEDGHLVLAAGQSVTLSSLNYDNIEFEVQAPANKVVNIGDMLSDGGSIGVFAGSIHNSGTISANAITVNDAGEIVLVAQNDNVQQDGTVTATSETGQGGHIEILGDRVGLFGQTSVDASGASGGGEVLVGGDYQGGNADVRNATQTVVGTDAQIRADAPSSGDGGKVIVWADENTRYHGTISATGGEQQGNGGLVEVSGKTGLEFDGAVDVSAVAGDDGSILLDPDNITIQLAPGANDDEVTPTTDEFIDFTDGTGDFFISETALEALLGSIELRALNGITINADVTLNLSNQTTGENFTLRAGGDIIASGDIITAGADVLFYAGDAGGTVSSTAAITINGVIDTNGGNLTLDTNASTGSMTIAAGGNANTLTIGSTGSLFLTGGTLTLASNSSLDGNLTINGSTAVFNAGGTLAIGGALNQNQGALTVTGDTTVTGLTSLSGGTIGGASAFNANGGVNVTGPVTLNTVLNTASSSTLSGTGAISGTGALSNSGSFDIQNDGTLAIDVTNSGTLTKSAGTSTMIANLINSNVINIQSGALTVSGNFTQSAGSLSGVNAITVAGLTTLSGGSLNAGGDFNANGGLDITGSVSTNRTLNVTGGSMTGAAALSNGGSGAFNLVGGTFTVGGSNVIDTDITVQGGTFDVLSGATLNSISSRTVINNDPSGILNIDGQVYANVSNGGTLSGVGGINGNVTNGGIVQPGGAGAAGIFTVTGNYTQSTGGTTEIELRSNGGGTTPTEGVDYDRLAITAQADTSGTLTLLTIDGYNAADLDSFTPITYGSRTANVFATINPTGIETVTPAYNPNSFSILLSISPSFIWDNGAGDGFWSSPLNWSSNLLPGISDDATIGAGYSVTLNSVASVNSLTLDGSLTLAAGGSLTLGSTSTFSSPSVFTMNAGALVANGGFTSNGAYTQNGGTATFNGTSAFNTVSLGAGSAVTMNLNAATTMASLTTGTGLNTPAILGSGDVTVTGASTLNNANFGSGGVINFNGGVNITGPVTLNRGTSLNGGTLSGAGAISGAGAVNNTGSFDIQNGGTLAINLSNSGSLTKSAGTATSITNLTNSGSINIQSGILNATSTFTQTAGSTLLSGGGLTVTTLSLNGGVLGGSGTVTGNVINDAGSIRPGNTGSTGLLTISGAYTQNSGGSIEIEVQGNGGVAGTDYDRMAVTGTVNLNGTMDIIEINPFTVGNGFTLTPLTYASASGVFGSINVPSSLSVNPSYDVNSLTVTIFDSTAAWIWDDGAGDGLWTTALNWSSNTLPGISDDATIGAGYSVTLNSVASVNSLTLDGSLTLAAGGSLTLGSPSTFSSPSVFTMNAGALVANGGFTSNGAYTQNGGTATFKGTSAFNTVSLGAGSAVMMNLNAATTMASLTTGTGSNTPLIQGSGNATVTGASTLNNANFGSGGVINFNGGVNITGPVTLNRVMNTNSTSTLSGAGAVVTSSTGTISNSGSFDLQNDGAIAVDVTNSGSLTKSTGTSNTITNLNNSGVINIQSGALTVSGNYTQSAGSLTGVNATTVAGLTSLSGGSLGGAGAFNANGGVNISGALALNTVLSTASTSTLSGAGAVSGTGAISNSGSFDIQNDSTLAINLTNSGSLIKSAGTATSITNLNNSGTINIQNGALAVSGDYTQSVGSLTGVNATTVAGLTSLSGGSLGGAGAFNANGGVNITGAVSLDTVFNVTGGSMTGVAALSNGGSGAFNLVGGTFTVGGSNVINTAISIQDSTFDVLAGATLNSISSRTVINNNPGGILNIDGQVYADVSNGGTLSGIGGINGNVTNSGTVQPGGAGAAGIFTVTGNYTQLADGTTEIEIRSNGGGTTPTEGVDYDRLAITAQADTSGTLTLLTIDGYNAADLDSFIPVTYGSRTANVFATINPTGIETVTPAYNPNSFSILLGVSPAITWDGGAGNEDWSNPLNWSNDILPDQMNNAAIGAGFSVTLDSVASPYSLALDGTLNLNLGGSLTLSGSSVFSASSVFNMNGGTLTANGYFTSNGAYTQIGGTATFNNTSISNGGYTQNGGTATFNGTSVFNTVALGAVSPVNVNFNGATTIAALTTAAGANIPAIQGTGDITVTGASILNAGSFEPGGVISFTGGVDIRGPLTLKRTLNAGGTSSITGAGAVSGAGAINNSGSFDLQNDGALEIDVSNSGSLIKSAGTSTSITNLTNSGVIDIQSDALAVSGNYTQSAGSLSGVNTTTVAGLTTLSGGSLGGAGAFDANGGVNISGALTLDTVLNTASSSTVSGAGAVSGTGVISNSGSFDIQNDGALAVDVSNSGNLIKSAGTSTSIANLTNSGAIDIQSGVLTVAGLTTLSGGSLGGAGAFDANGGVNITGAVSLDTVFNVTGGSMADGAALSDGGSGSSAFNLVGGTFTVGGSNVIDTAITIQDGTFDVLASGTLNNIGSPPVINNDPSGTLNIDGQVYADVVNDGTLSGVGSINGNVTNGGDFNPGNSPGTFTINGDLELLSSSNLNMEIAGLDVGQYDVLDVKGDVILGGKMNIFVISSSGYFGQLDDMFTPIKWLSTSGGGSIAVVSATPGYSFDSSTDVNGFSVKMTSIPGNEYLPSTQVLVFTDTLKRFFDPFVSTIFDEEDEDNKGQILVCS